MKYNVWILFHVDFKTRRELFGEVRHLDVSEQIMLNDRPCLWLSICVYARTHTHTHTGTHMHTFHPCICTILTATVLSLLLQELKIYAFCWNWDYEPVRVAETFFLFLSSLSWYFMTSYIGQLSFCGMKTDVVALFARLVVPDWCKKHSEVPIPRIGYRIGL